MIVRRVRVRVGGGGEECVRELRREGVDEATAGVSVEFV
jgi:hypothetical protein